jgi:uncharacterized protein YgiM (DUF1202 family)
VGEALATSEGAAAQENAAESQEDEESGQKTVTTRIIKATDVINIRSSDSETADILDKTEKGAEYKELEALANGWSRIEYKGGVAYVKTEFFDIVSEETVVVEKTEEEETKTETEAETEDNSETAAAATSESTTTADNKTDSSSTSSTTSTQSASGKVISDAKTGKMVVEQSIKFRKDQSTDSEAITTIYAGATVNVIEQYSNGWAKVEYNKKTGYIKSEFLRQ